MFFVFDFASGIKKFNFSYSFVHGVNFIKKVSVIIFLNSLSFNVIILKIVVS